MTALSKLLVLIAIFVSASYAHAFTSMSPVAGNQIHEKHWFQFEEPINDPTNEPRRTNSQTNQTNGFGCRASK